MRFACDKCSAKYSIADEKVRGKVLRIRCKKCGTIIEVREEASRPSSSPRAAAPGRLGAGAAPRPATRGAPRPTGTEPRAGSPAEDPTAAKAADSKEAPAEPGPAAPDFGADTSLDDEFERAFGRVVSEPGAEDAPAPSDSDKTVLFDYSRDFMNETATADRQEEASRPPATDLPEEWYLAIEGRQVGPLPVAEARARVQAAEHPERIYAWRDGMGDWQLVAEVPELRIDAPDAGVPASGDGSGVIEAKVVPSPGGVALVAENEAAAAPETGADPAAATAAPAAALDLEIEFGQASTTPAGAEPVAIEGTGARSKPFEPSPIAAPVVERPRRRVSVATLIILLVILGGAVALLLAALDVIYIPYISTEPEAAIGRGGRQGRTQTGRLLRRDPLLDSDSARIVVRQVPSNKAGVRRSTAKRSTGRKVSRRATATSPTPPAPTKPPAPDPQVVAKRQAMRNLERRVYGGGVGAPTAPTLPERFRAKTSIPLASSRGLSQAVISSVIRRYRGGIQNCYQKQLKVDSSVKGRMTLSLRIGKNGRVIKAGISGVNGRTVVGRCVLRMARTWRFPASGTDVDVDYPLILERPY